MAKELIIYDGMVEDPDRTVLRPEFSVHRDLSQVNLRRKAWSCTPPLVANALRDLVAGQSFRRVDQSVHWYVDNGSLWVSSELSDSGVRPESDLEITPSQALVLLSIYYG